MIETENADVVPSFVKSLKSLDTTTKAKLKRALHKTEWSPDVLSVVARYLPPHEGGKRDAALRHLSTVAVLYGCHSKDGGASIGTALLKMGEESRVAADRMLRQAINATRIDDLRPVLAKILFALNRADIPVNWLRLAKDIGAWEFHARGPQHRWAREFWGAKNTESR